MWFLDENQTEKEDLTREKLNLATLPSFLRLLNLQSWLILSNFFQIFSNILAKKAKKVEFFHEKIKFKENNFCGTYDKADGTLSKFNFSSTPEISNMFSFYFDKMKHFIFLFIIFQRLLRLFWFQLLTKYILFTE